MIKLTTTKAARKEAKAALKTFRNSEAYKADLRKSESRRLMDIMGVRTTQK